MLALCNIAQALYQLEPQLVIPNSISKNPWNISAPSIRCSWPHITSSPNSMHCTCIRAFPQDAQFNVCVSCSRENCMACSLALLHPGCYPVPVTVHWVNFIHQSPHAAAMQLSCQPMVQHATTCQPPCSITMPCCIQTPIPYSTFFAHSSNDNASHPHGDTAVLHHV